MEVKKVEVPNNIIVFDEPFLTNDLEWLSDHPDCDSIIEHIGAMLRVYAYAANKSANRALVRFRDEYYKGKIILAGMSRDGINSLF